VLPAASSAGTDGCTTTGISGPRAPALKEPWLAELQRPPESPRRPASYRNPVRRSVSSIQTSMRLAAAMSRCSSHALCAAPIRGAGVALVGVECRYVGVTREPGDSDGLMAVSCLLQT